MLGTFLSLTYYFQGTLHYSAMKSGLAFVPFSLGVITGATAASRLLPRFGPRLVIMTGLDPGRHRPRDVHPPRRGHNVCQPRPPGRGHRELRHGTLLRRHEQHVVDRRATGRRRGGECTGQHHPADGQLHGCRAHQHHRHRGHGVLPRRARHLGCGGSGRFHPRLHHRVRASAPSCSPPPRWRRSRSSGDPRRPPSTRPHWC